ncbi:cysteine--tRNA ligase [Candidatus Woesearchaeota archaeon]|nr:cysteine--tRNA ligase [Candidatus Woesearchaeota archaeon]
MLRFFNTLTGKKQAFKPIKKSEVGMYTCGPTVYDYAHIGNYRTFLFEDILRRYLKYKGYKVTQVMNLTDVDDKIIKKCDEQKIGLKEFTEKYTKAFFEDLDALNIQRAEYYPRATEFIARMVEITNMLLKKRIAYKTEDGIYYKITRFKKYGKLSKVEVKSLEAGASGRMRTDEYAKENVQDFALWKYWTKEDGEVFWETELGKGRPGWHIECSAMSTHFLGEQFDIHTGGVDNMFPHHENEIAQSEAAFGKKFVNYWLHSEHLLVEGQKMSKSLGNFYTLRGLLAKGYHGQTIRYALMSAHYKQKLNFSFMSLDSSKNAIERLKEFVRRLDVAEGKQNPKITKITDKAKKNFEKAMDDDLEISKALAAVFELVNKVNKEIDKNGLNIDDSLELKKTMNEFDSVLGLGLLEKEELDEEIIKLAAQREEARKQKEFAKADRIREEIKKKGYIIDDTDKGPVLKRA